MTSRGNNYAAAGRVDSVRAPLLFSEIHRSVSRIRLVAARKYAIAQQFHGITPEHVLLGVATLPQAVRGR